MYWRDLIPYFSRKELVKLQFASRFCVKAIEKLNPATLHVIGKLRIEASDFDDTVHCLIFKKGKLRRCHVVEDFRPPDYARFSEVTVGTLTINANTLECLKTCKTVFSGCHLWIIPFEISNETANETMRTLMEEIFTDCCEIGVFLNGWNSANQLNICSLSGVYKCDELHLDGDRMHLSVQDALFESMFEWLHNKPGKGTRKMTLKNFEGCEPLLLRLMLEFTIDVEPRKYLLCVNNLEGNFLNEFAGYSAKSPGNGEKLIATGFMDIEDGYVLCLHRVLCWKAQ
ncbi:hypothetical protein DdX_19437 [Ditylenchus destructor]|uniref:Uncharacterized protein n=1 Tax=Ditylenchus destructor TaxID=166010 RepID=A0AAD4QXE6_9BILA|nr:hypothetical protein DdX_19437 [Ditylenchus destructor]